MLNLLKAWNFVTDYISMSLSKCLYDKIGVTCSFSVYGDSESEALLPGHLIESIRDSMDTLRVSAKSEFSFLKSHTRTIFAVEKEYPYVVELARYSNTIYLSLGALKSTEKGIDSNLLACLLFEVVRRDRLIRELDKRHLEYSDVQECSRLAKEAAEELAIGLNVYPDLYIIREQSSNSLFCPPRY